MKNIAILLLSFLFTGCAKFAGYTSSTEFTDAGKPKTEIVTRFRGFTFLDSKAQLTKARAAQSAKAQSVGVATSDQESSGKTVTDVLDKVGSSLIKP